MISDKDKLPREILAQYPTDESVDPVESIVALLTGAGHPHPRRWLEDLQLHPHAVDPSIEQGARRFLVNRYWRTIVGMVENEDTTNARYCLMDSGAMFTWLLLFSDMMVPIIVKHDLPNLTW